MTQNLVVVAYLVDCFVEPMLEFATTPVPEAAIPLVRQDEAASQLAAVTAENARLRERIEQAYKAGFDFAMLTKSEDNDLAAENARLREALMDAKDALVAAEARDDQARFRANTPRQDVEVRHLRASAIDKARAALSQEAPK